MTAITGEAPTYGPDESTTPDGAPSKMPGGTPSEPYVAEVGDSGVFIRGRSKEEVDNFLAWLSLVSGKPIGELTVNDLLQHVGIDNFRNNSDHFANEDGNGISRVFSLEGSQWKNVKAFNDKEYFGDDIPEYPPGSGNYFGYTIEPGKGVQTSGGLYGFAGTAQMIYDANYPEGEELPRVDESKVSKEVLDLHKKMFGDVPMNQGHLNTLKMMGLVDGEASASPSTWTVTDVGAAVSAEWNKQQTAFVPAASLLAWSTVDWITALGAKNFFDDKGNLKNGTTTEVVEKHASARIDAMGPTETPLPPNMTLDQETQTMLNNLYGLPPSNTTFTAEQVNTAVAMGLVNIDPNTGAITLTTNGKGYLAAKTAEGEKPEYGGNTPPPPNPTIWDYYDVLMKDSAGDDKDEPDERGDGWQMADYLEGVIPDGNNNLGDWDNGNVGTHGIIELSKLTTDSAHWEDAGLGHLTTEERQELIDAAKEIVNHPEFNQTWSEMSEGNKVAGAVEEDKARDVINKHKHSDLTDPSERAAAMYNDTSVYTPEDTPTNDFDRDDVSSEDITRLNALTQKLFGKRFDDMTKEEQQKALWVLSTVGYIEVMIRQGEAEENRGGRLGTGSSSSGDAVTEIKFLDPEQQSG